MGIVSALSGVDPARKPSGDEIHWNGAQRPVRDAVCPANRGKAQAIDRIPRALQGVRKLAAPREMVKLQSPSPAGNSTSGPTALLTARELLSLRHGCPIAQDSFEHPRHQPQNEKLQGTPKT